MQRLEVRCAVRLIFKSLDVKELSSKIKTMPDNVMLCPSVGKYR